MKEHYGDGATFNVNITYIYQGEPKGIAHAVGLCEQFTGSSLFIVYLGDNLLKGGIQQYVSKFKKSKSDAMVLLCQVKEPQRFGVAQFDEDQKLVKLMEKPEVPPSNYALTGVYFFKPLIYDMIKQLKPSWRGELEITEALQLLIDKGYEVDFDFVADWWKDTGTPEDILEANRLILDELKPRIKGIVEDDTSIQGRVSIGENSIIKSGSLIRGTVIIGENTRIEEGVYIGPYTSIGNNVMIKKGEIENSIIMDNCIIDADEKIVDSLISSYSKIISNEKTKPRGRRFFLGERSQVEL